MIGGDVPVALPGDGNPGKSGVGRDSDYVGILDLVAAWDPSDELSAWLNFDAIFTHGDGLPHDNIGSADVRGRREHRPVLDHGSFDHQLAANLMLQLEGRYDVVDLSGVPDSCRHG